MASEELYTRSLPPRWKGDRRMHILSSLSWISDAMANRRHEGSFAHAHYASLQSALLASQVCMPPLPSDTVLTAYQTLRSSSNYRKTAHRTTIPGLQRITQVVHIQSIPRAIFQRGRRRSRGSNGASKSPSHLQPTLRRLRIFDQAFM